MSANNQTLIKEYKGKWYVFGNIMAESWTYYDHTTGKFDDKRINELELSKNDGVFNTRDEVLEGALEIESNFPTEYGVQFHILCKDNSEIKIIE